MVDIKRKENKPMAIHTKEKPQLHMKATPKTKIKGQDVLIVQSRPKIAGERENVIFEMNACKTSYQRGNK